ncbi:MAG: ABC transporter ATP-binding protein [Actinomycetaceae bacterium]|nr:ABC transporter ATP-binding protein [Actinomycetaceae bacterium]
MDTQPGEVGSPPATIELSGAIRHQGSFTLGPLDVTVPAGLVTGFVGPNGAGKTTMLKAILGLVQIHSGSISVLGDPPGRHHHEVGVALDALTLSHDWTAISAEKALARFYPSWDHNMYCDLLERLEVPLKTPVKGLSRGQGMKLQLALALAQQPRLLILDEPTSGLDPAARLEVLDLFRDFMVEEDRSLLFSTHITSDLERIADHIHIISEGHMVYSGPLLQLLERWAIARGPQSSLSPQARDALVGYRISRSGTFEGLIQLADTALFDSSVLIENPALDEAVTLLSRGQVATSQSE